MNSIVKQDIISHEYLNTIIISWRMMFLTLCLHGDCEKIEDVEVHDDAPFQQRVDDQLQYVADMVDCRAIKDTATAHSSLLGLALPHSLRAVHEGQCLKAANPLA